MKLIVNNDSPYLTKLQWKKVFTAVSIMTIALYLIAAVFSLLGSKYFIINYQNAQMDKIEAFLTKHNLMTLLIYMFTTVEFSIGLCFMLNRKPNPLFILLFYAPPMLIEYLVCDIPSIFYTAYCLGLWLILPFATLRQFNKKNVLTILLRFLIILAATFGLQFIIYEIKSGYFSVENHTMTLSAEFIYCLEYDIALSVILYTVSLYINREKGDNEVCYKDLTLHTQSGFSQTSKKKSQKLKKKELTKTQKNKLRLLYFRIYLIQLGGFLLLMVLPFVLGKVLEFLVLYLSFAVVRYILGFKYSLHYKKETLCITVGVIVFGIMSLAVPFFYVDVIIAVLLGTALAILLHLSYKYKGMWFFRTVARPDKFAELYVMFDGDLTEYHVKLMCKHYGLDDYQTKIIWELASGEKISTIAFRNNYSIKTIERQLNEAIETLNNNM